MKVSPVFMAAIVLGCGAAPLLPTFASGAAPSDRAAYQMENYVPEPMPDGIQVVVTELAGPVFADAAGHTLYRWPAQNTRNARVAGENPGVPACYDTRYRETEGLFQPYPAGNILPEVDTRATCTRHWPPMYAADAAKPIGNFTIVSRTDGKKQWAYKGFALYTSHLDQKPGETNGGDHRRGWDISAEGAPRRPAGPASAIPPQFAVDEKRLGRLLVTVKGASVYGFDKDSPTKSTCTERCLEEWNPVLAPEVAIPPKDWTILIRPNGQRQWVFRGQPLYTHEVDSKNGSYEGSDVSGWHNVFLQRAPAPPGPFKVVPSVSGLVLADARGKTIYLYYCVEDTPDALFCDSPDTAQDYRLSVCGGNDASRCLKQFPYVIADKGARSDNLSWGTLDIDPKTGHVAAKGAESLHVWAFRGRPIYTFADDRESGDVNADNWGQEHGNRNGFKAFWVREDFDTKMD